jgi:hypothetical protein
MPNGWHTAASSHSFDHRTPAPDNNAPHLPPRSGRLWPKAEVSLIRAMISASDPFRTIVESTILVGISLPIVSAAVLAFESIADAVAPDLAPTRGVHRGCLTEIALREWRSQFDLARLRVRN